MSSPSENTLLHLRNGDHILIKSKGSPAESDTTVPPDPEYFHMPPTSTRIDQTVLYRRGDYVYFEESPTMPYGIGHILEITQNRKSTKLLVNCFIRRQDVSQKVITSAHDEYAIPEDDQEVNYHELYLTAETQCLPSGKMRGKCTVSYLKSFEAPCLIHRQKDVFFCRLRYSKQKLSTFKCSSVRVGPQFQATVPPATTMDSFDDRKSEDLETVIYSPHDSNVDSITDRGLAISLAICNLGRAHGFNIKVPYLPECDNLHQLRDDSERALWTDHDKTLFDEAVEIYGNEKNRFQIICEHISAHSSPKTLKEIILYYYTWKKTDRGLTVASKVKSRQKKRKVRQTRLPCQDKPQPSPNEAKTKCESCQQLTVCTVLTCRLVPYTLCKSCREYWQRMDCLKL